MRRRSTAGRGALRLRLAAVRHRGPVLQRQHVSADQRSPVQQPRRLLQRAVSDAARIGQLRVSHGHEVQQLLRFQHVRRHELVLSQCRTRHGLRVHVHQLERCVPCGGSPCACVRACVRACVCVCVCGWWVGFACALAFFLAGGGTTFGDVGPGRDCARSLLTMVTWGRAVSFTGACYQGVCMSCKTGARAACVCARVSVCLCAT